MGIDHLDDVAARAQVRDRFFEADDEDLLLLDDLLGIADAGSALPDVAPDARRRRLTALFNAAALAQTEPAVYLIEDVHWIDETSESMLAQFISVIPQTPSLVLITTRPEYHGALSRVSGAQTIGLRPLSATQSSTLALQLLGDHPSLADVAARVSARAAGNPFFAEEMVRDLAERGVLNGEPGAFVLRGDAGDVDVPATLQATIGARVDRLNAAAKHTLCAAAVIGSRFDARLLADAVDIVDVAALIEAELVEQVRFGRREEYAFRHPLDSSGRLRITAQVGPRGVAPNVWRRPSKLVTRQRPTRMRRCLPSIWRRREIRTVPSVGTCGRARGLPTAISRPREAAGDVHSRLPTGYRMTSQTGRRCASHRGRCCAEARIG